MKGKTDLIKIPCALFKDDMINEQRGSYIMNILNDNYGNNISQELIQKYGYFKVPRSVFIQFKKGYLILADVTFLFACYYSAFENKKCNIKIDAVINNITKCWNEERTRSVIIRMELLLNNLAKYKHWIKKLEHNEKYYVKY